MTALNVQRSFVGCRAEDQATWPILIFWIIFDDLATGDCFSHLLYADTSEYALVNGMFGELELVRFYLFA